MTVRGNKPAMAKPHNRHKCSYQKSADNDNLP